MSVCDYSVNKCSGMRFMLLLRMGLCNSINKLSFRHSKKSFHAPPITRKLSRVALQLLQLLFKTAVLLLFLGLSVKLLPVLKEIPKCSNIFETKKPPKPLYYLYFATGKIGFSKFD